MRSFNAVHGIIVLAAIAIAAGPANAYQKPPKDTPISSSSGGGTPVPEPSSLILFGAGAAAFMMTKRRRKTEQ